MPKAEPFANTHLNMLHLGNCEATNFTNEPCDRNRHQPLCVKCTGLQKSYRHNDFEL